MYVSKRFDLFVILLKILPYRRISFSSTNYIIMLYPIEVLSVSLKTIFCGALTVAIKKLGSQINILYVIIINISY